MKTKCFTYLRTSGDDSEEKLGLPVQRESCAAFAGSHDLDIAYEFADDGICGAVSMLERPAGKLMISSLLADGVKIVLAYDAKRLGRTQPVFWEFVGMCRKAKIKVLEAISGNDLTDPIMGAVNGLFSEMDRDAIIKRLAEGKKIHRALGHKVEGRYFYGEHPEVRFIHEKGIVARIVAMHEAGQTCYAIAKTLNAEGIKPRWGKSFRQQTIFNILRRQTERKES